MARGSVFYVHGSGNRGPEVESYGARIAIGLGVPPEDLHLSYWGDGVGPDPAFPQLAATMPAAPDVVPETTAELLADPLAPLRALAPGDAAGPGAAAGDLARADARAILGQLQFGRLDLSEAPVSSSELAAAAAEVAASPEFAVADGDAVALIDAAVTAAAARAAVPLGPAGVALDPVGRVKVALSASIMGGVGIIGTTTADLSGATAVWVSEQLAKHRTAMMQANIAVAADILFYQRHSAEISQHVRGEIRALAPPRLLLGHSLGGIILVDTLFGADAVPIDVDLLVTFGSQAPLLAALEAFGPVRPGGIPWLNIWTRFDFVSFLAAGLWPGAVTDFEIPSTIGFPQAHGTYYDSPEFYAAIRGHPAAKAVLGEP
jgi:hypothetical protein